MKHTFKNTLCLMLILLLALPVGLAESIADVTEADFSESVEASDAAEPAAEEAGALVLGDPDAAEGDSAEASEVDVIAEKAAVDKSADAVLIMGEDAYSQEDIDTSDFGSDCWYWDHSSRKLVLFGLKGANDFDIISANRLDIIVQGGSKNFVRLIYLAEGGTISGDGALYCYELLTSASGSLTLQNCEWHGSIASLGPVTVDNVYGDCDIATQDGDVRIENSCIRGKAVAADGSLNVNGSLVEAFSSSDADSGLLATGKVTVKQSLILCQNIYGVKGTSIDKNTAVFVYSGDSNFVLWKSATLKKSFDLPEMYSYTIPKKLTLTIAKGCVLSHLGRLFKYGKIKGTLIDRDFYPGDVEIQGASEMAVGSSQVLTCRYLSGERTVNTEWTSSAPRWVSVDRNGKVTVHPAASAHIGETASITASVMGASGTIDITIVPGTENIVLEVNGRTITALELWLDPVNKAVRLDAAVSPANAQKHVVWRTGNARVASVSADGTVTANRAGTTDVWAEATDGTGVASPRVAVTVMKAPGSVKVDKKMTLSYDPITGVGTEDSLNVTLSKGSASSLTYSGYDTDVVTVDGNGRVTAVGPGRTKITVTTYNKRKATCTVTVINPCAPTGIKLDRTGTVKLKIGETVQLNAALIPDTAIDDIKWTTGKPSVATVENGLVTACGKGTATITAATSNGKTAKISVKVSK